MDEAYLPFAAHAPSLVADLTPNMLVLHSMTKAHALAGLRLGYAVGPPDIIAALARVRPPWRVNALAQAAGIAALQERPMWRPVLPNGPGEARRWLAWPPSTCILSRLRHIFSAASHPWRYAAACLAAP